jgi:hypothetical protein
MLMTPVVTTSRIVTKSVSLSKIEDGGVFLTGFSGFSVRGAFMWTSSGELKTAGRRERGCGY